MFYPSENIDGVMETTVDYLTTLSPLPLQNNLRAKSSPSVAT